MKISAVIIAKNEEKSIKDCIESINWADEIVVLDTGSQDKTVEIAQKMGATILKIRGGSFNTWRERGAAIANGEWLFYIDADERVSPLLRKEIQETIERSKYNAYAIPRRNILLDHEMKYGGWWPDYVLRLIRKDALLGYQGELHEQPKIKGDIAKLHEPFIHITHESLTEMIDKTNEWSEIEARLLYSAHHPKVTWWRFGTVAAREFWERAILKLGFLDGPIGIIEIFYQMISRMITYAKLWELQITNK